jgi:hypothetical protein
VDARKRDADAESAQPEAPARATDAAPGKTLASALLALQASAGNQAVVRLLRRQADARNGKASPLARKLKDDELEGLSGGTPFSPDAGAGALSGGIPGLPGANAGALPGGTALPPTAVTGAGGGLSFTSPNGGAGGLAAPGALGAPDAGAGAASVPATTGLAGGGAGAPDAGTLPGGSALPPTAVTGAGGGISFSTPDAGAAGVAAGGAAPTASTAGLAGGTALGTPDAGAAGAAAGGGAPTASTAGLAGGTALGTPDAATGPATRTGVTGPDGGMSFSTPDAGRGPTTGPEQTPGLPDAPPGQMTLANPQSGIDWDKVFSDDNIRIGRYITEVGRLVPVVGLGSGVVADGLQTLADFKTIEGEEAPFFKTALVIRNVANMANNAVGHILYVDQLVQDGLVASGVGAPFAGITATINEIGKGWKVALDGAIWFGDMGMIAAAGYRQQKAPPGSDSARKWEAQSRNYVANVIGDFVTFILDAMDLPTAGATQGSGIDTAVKAAKGGIPILKWAAKTIPPIIQSWWNIEGGDILPSSMPAKPAAPAAAAGVQRMMAGRTGPLVQRLEASGVSRAMAYQIIATELRQMKTAYQVGDTVLDAMVQVFSHQKEQAYETAKKLMGGRDPFITLRDGTVQALNIVRNKIGQAAQMEVFATTADQKTQAVKSTCENLLGKIDSLQVPNVQLKAPDLGEGTLANIAEGVLGAGAGLANQGINAIVGRVRGALDSAKGMAKAPIESVKSHSQEVGEFMQILSKVAKDQVVFCQTWVDDVSKKLAKCQNGEQVIDMVVQKVLSLAGIEGEFKIDDLRKAWRDLGPMIDEAVVWAEQRRAAALAEESGQPGPKAAPGEPPDSRGQGARGLPPATPAGVPS